MRGKKANNIHEGMSECRLFWCFAAGPRAAATTTCKHAAAVPTAWKFIYFDFFFFWRRHKTKKCGRDAVLQSNANFRFEIPVRSRIDRLWICLCFFFFASFFFSCVLVSHFSLQQTSDCFLRAHISIIISVGWVAWRPVFWARSMCEDKMSSSRADKKFSQSRGYELGGVVDTLTYCTRCDCIHTHVDGRWFDASRSPSANHWRMTSLNPFSGHDAPSTRWFAFTFAYSHQRRTMRVHFQRMHFFECVLLSV